MFFFVSSVGGTEALAGQGHGLAQDANVANMVGQQQDQPGVDLLALLVGQVAVGVDQRFVEVVARREVAEVALAGFVQVGLELQGVHRRPVQELQVARPTAWRTASRSNCRHRAATCWSGRSR